MGVFTYSPEEGTSSFDLDGGIPEVEAAGRRDAVLGARDAALAKVQAGLVGTELEILVDERVTGETMTVIGRGAMDAPEVDLLTIVPDCTASIGERLRVRVTGLDEENNALAEALA
jgi:ribosomal protein S12 methylthiotransferase